MIEVTSFDLKQYYEKCSEITNSVTFILKSDIIVIL